jgi:hypothetical protein
MMPQLRKKLTPAFALLVALAILNNVSIINGINSHQIWRVDIALICDVALFAFAASTYLATKNSDEEQSA